MLKMLTNPHLVNPIMIYFATDTVPLLSRTLFTDIAQYSDHITALVIALLLMPFVKPLFEG